jgi:hypothetical protein
MANEMSASARRVSSERSSHANDAASRRCASLALLAARVVESLGGRYSVELGIDVDRGEDEIERWALAATLFGGRISAKIAERTFAVLDGAGAHSIADAGRLDIGHLIELLDARGLRPLRPAHGSAPARHRANAGGGLERARELFARSFDR